VQELPGRVCQPGGEQRPLPLPALWCSLRTPLFMPRHKPGLEFEEKKKIKKKKKKNKKTNKQKKNRKKGLFFFPENKNRYAWTLVYVLLLCI
jgi:hypothetical protein